MSAARAVLVGVFGLFLCAAAHAVQNAAFISQSVPSVMAPGQTYAVSITMRNTGDTTWSAAPGYKLATQNPPNNVNWGFAGLPVPGSVAPGQNVTFNFNVTAPTTPGTYNFQWRMVQDFVEWFGDFTPNVAVKVGLNDAAFVSQSVPSVMVPGQTYAVSVTMQNTGGSTWTSATSHKLGTQNAQDNTLWTGSTRRALPASVAPGANVTFNFNVTAPTTPGTYNFQWRMVQDGVEWFGAQSANVAVKVGLNDAAFVSQSVPAVMTPGQSYPVTVTMNNNGGRTWSSATSHKLGTQNPQDNNLWTGSARVALPGTTAPGTNAAFSFNVTAPTTPGTYNFQWKMVQDGVEWFGAQSPSAAIKVGLNDAAFVSQDVPAVMVPGQSYTVSITMQNSGGKAWTTGTHRLGSQNPQLNTTWANTGRMLLPAGTTVATGATVTFSTTVTAPSTPGTYNFQWRMFEELGEWFGPSTPNVAVQVNLTDADFVSQSVPSTMVAGQAYPVSVTMQNSGNTTWAAGTVGLGSQNPQSNTTWGSSKINLASPVAPGAQTTLNFNVTAPSSPGIHNFQWRMVEGTNGWFGGQSTNVAVVVGGSAPDANVHFIHVDHLNTPRLVANQSGQTVWRWDQQEPFGVNVPDENPSSFGAFEFPLRFPGQYADKETNLHYNYLRDYDPGTGRYVQSDPMGLDGGLNTYAYVESAPLADTDFYGLITGSMKHFRRVNCPEKERDECIQICKEQGKAMESCKVTRGRRVVLRNGVKVWELYTVPGSMSCKCKDCEEDNALQRFWNWLTQPGQKPTDDPFSPYTGGGRKPDNPFGPPPPTRLPVFP